MNSKKIQRILIARGDVLGDAVLSTVLIAPLKQAFPDAQLYFLLRPEVAPLLEGHPDVAGVLSYPFSGAIGWRDWQIYKQLIGTLRTYHFDVFIGMWEKPHVAWLAFFSRSPIRIGYKVGLIPRILYTHTVSFQKQNMFVHQSEYNLAMLHPLLPDTKYPIAGSLYVSATQVQRLIDKYPFVREAYLCVQVDGTAAQKTWFPETCAAVINGLKNQYPTHHIVAIGRPNPERMQRICAGLQTTIVDLTNQMSLPELMALLSRSRLLVGLDSGVSHIAAVLGVQTVTYFIHHAQSALRWAPIGPYVQLIHAQHGCTDKCIPSVCHKPTCREGLQVAEILSATANKKDTQIGQRLGDVVVGLMVKESDRYQAVLAKYNMASVVLPSGKFKACVTAARAAHVNWIVTEKIGIKHWIIRTILSNHVALFPALTAQSSEQLESMITNFFNKPFFEAHEYGTVSGLS